jgi:hypothetical protein
VKQNLPSRALSNGKVYCLELARTEGQQDDCAADLEDNVYLREQDRVRAIGFVDRFVERLKLSRNPCGWWERLRRAKRCAAGKAD